LDQQLLDKGLSSYLLDGDTLRGGLCSDLKFSAEDRQENLRRASEVAKILANAGNICLCSFITPSEESRLKVRDIIGEENLLEVFVDCSLEECERRDVKGLYKQARSGEIKEFTGISSPFDRPANRSGQLVVNSEKRYVEENSKEIISKIFSLIK
jgi:adenylylsulfate kinase